MADDLIPDDNMGEEKKGVTNSYFDGFIDTLLSDMGVGDLPEEERVEFVEKIGELVNKRIINLVLVYLPEDKEEEFNRLAEGEDQGKLFDFILTAVPGIEEKISNELVAIRSDLVAMKKNEQ